MGSAVVTVGCGVFMMQVENHGPLLFSCHFEMPAFMCGVQWDVKIHGRVGQTCSFNINAFISVIVPCTNRMMSIMLDLSSPVPLTGMSFLCFFVHIFGGFCTGVFLYLNPSSKP